MQDPSTYTLMNPQFPEQEHLKCPRCDSSNTKFCYYNNYNLSQPRHFCKNCRRYWTKGGTLRNIPVGGGTRKNTKRSSNPKHPKPSSSSSLSSPSLSTLTVTESSQPKPEPSVPMIRTSFSSLLGSNGQFGNLLLEGLNGSVQVGGFENDGSVLGSEVGLIGNLTDHEYNQRNFNDLSGSVQSGGGDSSSCWNGDDNGWPDLSIYTPGSSFQ